MSGDNGWLRVSRARPCPICGKPDWCAVSANGAVALCQRIESAKRCGDGGWLHRLREEPHTPRGRPRRTFRLIGGDNPGRDDLDDLMTRFRAEVDPDDLSALANALGVLVENLNRLGIGWSGWGWTFPMVDASGAVRGIRVRKRDGTKLAIPGSREGLFIPSEPVDRLDGLDGPPGVHPADARLLICEGPTDTAALLDLGFDAVGRPSCVGGTRLIVDLVRKRRPGEVVIVADLDGPGQRGAMALASRLLVQVVNVRVVTPPDGINDAREWKRAGATREDIEDAIESVPARHLEIRCHCGSARHGW